MKERIAILYGGKSGEHQVSRESAASVIRNIDRDRFDLILISLDEEGAWFLQPDSDILHVLEGNLPPVGSNTAVSGIPGSGLSASGQAIDVDLVFPVLHGTNGEDGTVQGFLEILDLPYAGADILTSSLGMDKIRAKEMWQNNGLEVVPYVSLEAGDFSDSNQTPTLYQEWSETLGTTFFVKPARAGSSVGISKVKRPEELLSALKEALRFDNRILIEQAIDAREIECSVLGSGTVESFPPGEVISHREFYDYEGKYLDPDGASLEYPAKLPADMATEFRQKAVRAFQAIGGNGLARVDFFLDRKNGTIYINEINTMPGFTSISMFPKMCETGGLQYTQLLTRMVELGLERHRQRSSLDLRYQN